MKKLLLIYGTRPEAIKMAPVVKALRRRSDLKVVVGATGQHREMLDQVEGILGLKPDFDLQLMRPNQGLNNLSSRAFDALDQILEKEAPDWLLVQGDTTTAMTAALAAFHRRIHIGHVEAGLRTGDLSQPFPEEANRRIIDLVADACFVPTPRSRRALENEGYNPDRIFVTGNTVVDALEEIRLRVGVIEEANEVLITVHRRESFGRPLRDILRAIQNLALSFPQTRWIYPVHPNPNVRGPVSELLADLPNVQLEEPFDYLEFIRRLSACRFVLTDSGGVQEEAPSFGKPLLVLRETTERPEGIEAGVARLVGVSTQRIVEEASRLVTDTAHYRSMSRAGSPYGDGQAATRIAAILMEEPWQPWHPPELAIGSRLE